MTILNRCLFIEGIGRVHAICGPGRCDVAAIDYDDIQDQWHFGMLAADVVTGDSIEPFKIRWAVRFREKQA